MDQDLSACSDDIPSTEKKPSAAIDNGEGGVGGDSSDDAPSELRRKELGRCRRLGVGESFITGIGGLLRLPLGGVTAVARAFMEYLSVCLSGEADFSSLVSAISEPNVGATEPEGSPIDSAVSVFDRIRDSQGTVVDVDSHASAWPRRPTCPVGRTICRRLPSYHVRLPCSHRHRP